MAHSLRIGLLVLALLLGLVVLVLILAEPFLNLPPFWEQLDVGLALTSYGLLMLLGVFVTNRKLWPRKWRLSHKPTGRLQFMKRVVATAWGIDENNDSGE